MNMSQLQTLEHIRRFLQGTEEVVFEPVSKPEAYQWISATLTQLNYQALKKREKGEVQLYLCKVSAYSRQQMTRLIKQHQRTSKLCHQTKTCARNGFKKRYTPQDIALLAEVDKLHHSLSGTITKKICERAFFIFHQHEFERLATLSVAHLYRLRHTFLYQQKHQHYTKTHATTVPIGERRKPAPNGKPGFIRIDTVHQGDQDKQKGVYHINAVDEVTQFEIVCSVEKISEAFLIPVLEFLLDAFPFATIAFHSDNGSEYINQRVCELLQKLLIEQTKSRARHSNDNGLVETKNGSIIRKQFGYTHIQQKWAPIINVFNQAHLNPYLNFHRPCHFVKTVIDKRGKEKKTYPYTLMMTPYDKLKSLPQAEQYLNPGVTFKALDSLALSLSDNEAAKRLNEAKQELFKTIFEREKYPAALA